jgi:hypothetical protein
MKKIIITVVIFSTWVANAQEIVALNSGYITEELPPGSYIKDINNEFDKFHGTWVWTNGEDTVKFILRKITHKQFPAGYYQDYMIGNYIYTKEHGLITVVNTLSPPRLSTFPEDHPMYAPSVLNDFSINFTFDDVVLDKSYSEVVFEFLPGSTTQMKLKFINREGYGVV